MKKKDIILDITAFVASLILAIVLKWEAKDLIWALWISSLTLGYASIVISIVGMVLNAEGKLRILAAFGGLFMLGFFTFHFGMFHFVHAMFLNGFFPLTNSKEFGNALLIPIVCLSNYWPFIIASLVSRPEILRIKKTDIKKSDPFMKPYANVIRMHILIFVFAGLHAAKLTHLAIYPVMAFYFFPWSAFLKRRKENASRKETEQT